jgi:hypothetical protein
MIERVYSRDGITIYQGDADEWPGDEKIDLVLTNPYGPMPARLRETPMILHQWGYRKHEAERLAGIPIGSLQLIGTWNSDRESFWAANMEARAVDLQRFKPVAGGWYPEELPRILLRAFACKGWTIWDGFMGRGTVGKAARELGMKYVGVEQRQAHVDLALDYLELRSPS